MSLLTTNLILAFECERERCGEQSPHYVYDLPQRPTDKQIRVEIKKAIELARENGWFILSTSHSVCPSCFRKTLEDVRAANKMEVY